MPTERERLVLRVIGVFEGCFPALAHAAPEAVERFQVALERELEGRPGRRRRSA